MTNPNDPWQQQPGGQPQQPQYPQQQYPQQQYPGGGMPPPREQHMPVAQQRPNSVELSYKLWMANVILGVVGAILTFVLLDDIIEQAADEVGVSAEAAKDAAQPVVMTGLVIGLLLLAGIAALAFQMRNGKNWARITLTVFGAIVLILALVSVGDQFAVAGLGVLLGLIAVIRLLLIVGAVVLMYTKDSNPFFASPQNR